MVRVRQEIDATAIPDVAAAVNRALRPPSLREAIRPGMRIGIAVGSRGIDRLVEVLRETVRWIRARGASPFLIAAMGSHGGARARGRRQALEGLGATEQAVGAPIEVEGASVVLGEVQGLPVHWSRSALQADGVVVINRVKPHTSFSGRYESGLVKMLTVGLGGPEGASVIHARGPRALADLLPEMARMILARGPVLFGLALLENGLHRLRKIEAVPADAILAREPALLEQARTLSPALPLDEADVLVVDFLGKDISGTGMDTRVIGRLFIPGEPEPATPRFDRLVVLRLSPGSRGNAYGIGLADVTTDRLTRAMDPVTTRANAVASTFLERVRIPLTRPSDREAIQAALETARPSDPESPRIVRIRDTRHLETFLVSESVLAASAADLAPISGPEPWPFDREGNLPL